MSWGVAPADQRARAGTARSQRQSLLQRCARSRGACCETVDKGWLRKVLWFRAERQKSLGLQQALQSLSQRASACESTLRARCQHGQAQGTALVRRLPSPSVAARGQSVRH